MASGEPDGPGPLLVIAGAGAGKTNMLAHRVAHLILTGADPKRIMLATFSRRAAGELNRRVQRLLARKLAPEAAAAATPAFAGTFHSIGARLLRDHALRLGLDPQFTIHDREDSADLMNFERHELGLSGAKERFPTKGTCLAIYSRAVNGRASLAETLGKHFPWCASHEEAVAQSVRRLCRGQAAPERARLRRSPALFRADDAGARYCGRGRRPLRSSARRRISGHQSPAGRNRAGFAPARARADGGRRRRAIDLFVSRRHGAQHPRFSQSVRSAGASSSRSTRTIARPSRSSPRPTP